MSNRKIDLEVKVQAMLECMHLQDVETVMHKYGLSERSAYNWFEKIKAQLPEILQDARPGRKGSSSSTSLEPPRLAKTADNR